METAQFKAWFGNSQVRGCCGKPLTVYHGTRQGGFTVFRPNCRKNEQLGFGIHFAISEPFARQYAEHPIIARKGKAPQVYAAYLKAEKILDARAIVDEGTPEYALARKLGGSRVYAAVNPEIGKRQIYMKAAIDMTSGQRAERIIREAGYDAIAYNAVICEPGPYGAKIVEEGLSLLVFSPGQVKSATDNCGAFDGNNPDITC